MIRFEAWNIWLVVGLFLLPRFAKGEDFNLEMHAAGTETVISTTTLSVIRTTRADVNAGIGDSHEGDATQPFATSPLGEISALSAGGSGCGWYNLTCYSSHDVTGSAVACDSGTVHSFKLKAAARCTIGCCSGHYTAVASFNLAETSQSSHSESWAAENVSTAAAVTRFDIPRPAVGDGGGGILPLARVTDYGELGGTLGSGIPPSSVRTDIDDGVQLGYQIVATTRVTATAEYFASSDNPKVLVGAFNGPSEFGPASFPENGMHAWATLAELGVNLPPVIAMSITGERSTIPGAIRVFGISDEACFSAHPFSFHLPPENVSLQWSSEAFPEIAAASVPDPSFFCSSELSVAEGPVEVVVQENDPVSGEVTAESNARERMRVSPFTSLLLHDWWRGPKDMNELKTALQSASEGDELPATPTVSVDLTAAQSGWIQIPISFPIPPSPVDEPLEALFKRTKRGHLVYGSTAKKPIRGLFAIDSNITDIEFTGGTSILDFIVAAITKFLIDNGGIPSEISVAEIPIPIPLWKDSKGESASQLVLGLSLRNMRVEFDEYQGPVLPETALGLIFGTPRLRFEVGVNGRIDIMTGAIIDDFETNVIPIFPNPLIDGPEFHEASGMVNLGLRFNLTHFYDGADLQGAQGTLSIVSKTRFKGSFAKGNGSVASYLPTLASDIADAKTASGLDRVNLVGHGLGGLVARHYSEFEGTDVNKLVLIGTPNHGADFYFAAPILAKWLIKLAIRATGVGTFVAGWMSGFIGSAIDASFGPAAKDMTPHSNELALLNGHRGDTSDPEYERFPIWIRDVHTISGSAEPVLEALTPIHFHLDLPIPVPEFYPLPNSPGFEIPGIAGLCIIPGLDCNPHGDLMVPEDSVILSDGATPLANDRVSSIHWSLHDDNRAINTVEMRLADDPPTGAFETRTFGGVAAQSSPGLDTVIEAGDTSTLTIRVDPGASSLRVDAISDMATVSVTLTGPAGQHLPVPVVDVGDAIYHAVQTIDSPTPGEWQAHATVDSGASDSASVQIQPVFATSSFVALSTGRSRYYPGQDAFLSILSYSHGALVAPLEAGFVVRDPLGNARWVQCLDDGLHGDGTPGDGFCVGQVPQLVHEGSYVVVAWARVPYDEAGLPTSVDRRAYATFEVNADVNVSLNSIVSSTQTPISGDTLRVAAEMENQSQRHLVGIPVLFEADGTPFTVRAANLAPGQVVELATSWNARAGDVEIAARICPFTGVLETREVPGGAGAEPRIELAVDDNRISTPIAVEFRDLPVARTHDVKTHAGIGFLLDASASTSEAPIVSYEWVIGNPNCPTHVAEGQFVSIDPEADLRTQCGVSVIGDVVGLFPVKLLVTDQGGRTATAVSQIEVLPRVTDLLSGDREQPVISVPDAISVMAGDPVVLDGSASSDSFGIAWSFWDLNSARLSPQADFVGLQANIPDGFQYPGDRPVRFYVNDIRGNGPVEDGLVVHVLPRPVVVELFAPDAIEAGASQLITVVVRDEADRYLVSEGQVQLSIGRGRWIRAMTECGTAMFNQPWDIAPGSYSIEARYFDGVRFAEGSASIDSFSVVDTTGPTSPAEWLDTVVHYFGDEFAVEVSVDDDGSPVADVQILLDGQPAIEGETIGDDRLPLGDHFLEATATDLYGNETTTQSDIVVCSPSPPALGRFFEGGLCTAGDLVLRNNAIVSSPSSPVLVGGSIVVWNNAQVVGDIVCGCDAEFRNNASSGGDVTAGRDVIVDCHANIGGEVVGWGCRSCDMPPTLCPPVNLQELSQLADNLLQPTVDSLTALFGASETTASGKLTVASDTSLELLPGIYSLTDLQIENNGQLTVTEGRVLILVRDGIEIECNAAVGVGGGELAIVALSDSPITLANNAIAHVVVTAPRAEVTVLGNNVLFEGGIAADTLRVSNNAHLAIRETGRGNAPVDVCQ